MKILFRKWSIIFLWLFLSLFIFLLQQNFANASTIQNKYQNKSAWDLIDFIHKNSLQALSNAIKQAQDEYESRFDLTSDYSFQKYISDETPLKNKKYVPQSLVQIDSEYIVNRAWRPYLQLPAQMAFEEMAKDFYISLSKQLYLISAYRTYLDQATLFERWCSLDKCAKIWASEHQLWLAVDIHLATKKWYEVFSSGYLDWMNENAYKYWFINTYRKWIKIDGKRNEARHRRYVWIPLATAMFKKDLSFSQRYYSHISWQNLAFND